MIEQIETVWTAHSSDDERGASAVLLGIFTDEEHAKEAAHMKGWYGGDGNVEKRKALLLSDGQALLLDRKVYYPVTLDANLPQEREVKFQAALAKLTPEEIDLLGIKGG